MDNVVIFTHHSSWTYGLVNTLIGRGIVPRGIVFEGTLHETFAMKYVRFFESLFLWAEHVVFFRRHTDPHASYRRFGSLKKLLEEHKIAWLCTDNHNSQECESFLKNIKPEYILLCSTRMIKPHILGIPSKGTLNAHSAMLPKYRGAKSEYWILSQNDPNAAGVTVHWVDPTLDTGAICLQERLHVSPYETTKTLRAKSIAISAHLFAETLRRLGNGEQLRMPQGEGAHFSRPPAGAVQAFDAAILSTKEKS